MFRASNWLRKKEDPPAASPVRALFAGVELSEPRTHAPRAPAPVHAAPPREAPTPPKTEEVEGPGAQLCSSCGEGEVLLAIDGAPTCYGCLSARFQKDGELYRRWLLGEQLRTIEKLAQAGTPLAPETTTALIGDLRRLRRCIFEIQDRVFQFDEDPAAWSDVRRMGELLVTILSLTQEVDPQA